jgi:hypothetical protein
VATASVVEGEVLVVAEKMMVAMATNVSAKDRSIQGPVIAGLGPVCSLLTVRPRPPLLTPLSL